MHCWTGSEQSVEVINRSSGWSMPRMSTEAIEPFVSMPRVTMGRFPPVCWRSVATGPQAAICTPKGRRAARLIGMFRRCSCGDLRRRLSSPCWPLAQPYRMTWREWTFAQKVRHGTMAPGSGVLSTLLHRSYLQAISGLGTKRRHHAHDCTSVYR
jgi:hypothetical protein